MHPAKRVASVRWCTVSSAQVGAVNHAERARSAQKQKRNRTKGVNV